MNIYVDADVLSNWEKGAFDLPAWIVRNHPADSFYFPPTVWQQLLFGKYAWNQPRAQKRIRYLQAASLPVTSFSGLHADRAAQLAAEMKLDSIGFADFQIAACALVDGAALLTFNTKHFTRVTGLQVLSP